MYRGMWALVAFSCIALQACNGHSTSFNNPTPDNPVAMELIEDNPRAMNIYKWAKEYDKAERYSNYVIQRSPKHFEGITKYGSAELNNLFQDESYEGVEIIDPDFGRWIAKNQEWLPTPYLSFASLYLVKVDPEESLRLGLMYSIRASYDLKRCKVKTSSAKSFFNYYFQYTTPVFKYARTHPEEFKRVLQEVLSKLKTNKQVNIKPTYLCIPPIYPLWPKEGVNIDNSTVSANNWEKLYDETLREFEELESTD